MGWGDINPFKTKTSNQTSTMTSGPGQYSPYIDSILGQATNLNQTQAPQYSQLYGGQSAMTQQGAQNLGQFQPQTSQAAGGHLQSVLGGDYLNGNPYLDQTFNRAADQTQARLGSQFAGAGRSGSGAFMGASGQAYGDLANSIYGGNYQAERGRQMQAAGMAPGIDQGNQMGAYAQLAGGQVMDQGNQQMLAEQERMKNFGYNAGWDNLGRYLGAVTTTTAPYGQQSQATPVSRNPMGGILGGAIGGGQFGSQFGNQSGSGMNWGTILGAVGGGLLGSGG